MLQENEVISCILTVGAVFFVLVNGRAAARIPHRRLLLSALLFFLLSNLFTVCEGFWLSRLFNALEHSSYVISLGLLAVWCRRVYCPEGRRDV